MRTTVTIDAENLLRAEVKRTGRSLKQVLNLSIRRSLLATPKKSRQITILRAMATFAASAGQRLPENGRANKLIGLAMTRDQFAP